MDANLAAAVTEDESISDQNYPKYISDVASKILEKKTQLSDTLSEFVIFLKLGLLWGKLKIFIANFSHVSPSRFWRILSMLLNSHPTIKWHEKKSVAISLMLNHNLTGLNCNDCF